MATSQTVVELEEPHNESIQNNSIDAIAPAPGAEGLDRGYGWVAVFGCTVITWWFVGTTYSWGVIQAALVKEGLSQVSTLSFVGSLTVACIALLSVVNARLITVIGAQKAGLLGISLLGTGEVLGGFATHNIGALFATIGVTMGIGTSMCFMTVSVVPAQWFARRRGTATGVVFAGGGLGGAAISLTMQQLVDKLGPAWTLRVIGLLTLTTGLPAAWLLKERSPPNRAAFVDWSLLKSLRFDLLFASGVLATFPLFVPPFFLPLYCQTLQLKPAVGAGMVAVFNFSSALGRVGCGMLCDYIGPLNVLFSALLLSGISMLALWPFSSALAPLIIFVILDGFANGGFFALMPTVVGSMFGTSKVPLVMGMVVTGWAGGYLFGGPIAGYILQASIGSESGIAAYRPAMYYAGSMSIAAAALVASVRLRFDLNLMRKI